MERLGKKVMPVVNLLVGRAQLFFSETSVDVFCVFIQFSSKEIMNFSVENYDGEYPVTIEISPLLSYNGEVCIDE